MNYDEILQAWKDYQIKIIVEKEDEVIKRHYFNIHIKDESKIHPYPEIEYMYHDIFEYDEYMKRIVFFNKLCMANMISYTILPNPDNVIRVSLHTLGDFDRYMVLLNGLDGYEYVHGDMKRFKHATELGCNYVYRRELVEKLYKEKL